VARTGSDGFLTVTTQGGLLPQDLLQRVANRDRDLRGTAPSSYDLARGEKLNQAINDSWLRLERAWKRFTVAMQDIQESNPATGLTRDHWLKPLIQELGYGSPTPWKAQEIEGKSYPISHMHGNVPLHLLGFNLDLDRRSKGVAGAARQSPHSLVQEFLNHSEDHLWGMLSNGLRLRILRDNITLTRQAYVEFDLEAMMEGEVYSDFALLWMVCHATRLQSEDPYDCVLEQWTKTAEREGVRALESLRKGVEDAIRHLGEGFLSHPANTTLRESLRDGSLHKQDYYRQLLRTVYRLLFLFAAEDRNLLHHPDAPNEAKERYDSYYSTARLRTIAESHRGTQHPDLWEGLKLVFQKLGFPQGCPELGLPALGSFLWDEGSTPDLMESRLANKSLLHAVRDLSTTREDNVTRRVDYRNMGAEELGSIYESLLELHPEINTESAHFQLEVLAGHERKTTGSYYTPTELINELLDSALEPVVRRAVAEARTKARTNEENPQEAAEQALLDLKVCDPASGSGHFLIAAAHRMARHLSRIRTGEEEAAPEAYRAALRDVISHCIYGVDINPMAVELCKVSLWMEALQPGRPLSFLDHHIKCGNSLLGTTPQLLADGIPNDAYKPITGDDKKFARQIRKKNKDEKKGQRSLQFGEAEDITRAHDRLRRKVMDIDRSGNETYAQVAEQQAAYQTLTESTEYEKARLAADLWCAAFAWPKTPDDPTPPTQAVLERVQAGEPLPQQTWQSVKQLARDYKFFHWHVEYPEIFTEDNPGFDAVLGNPPWEHTELKEKEFFANTRPDIADAPGARRKKMIEVLKTEDPELYSAFIEAKRQHDLYSHFARNSGKYPLCGRGRINTYALFAEINRLLINGNGRVGCIVPSGIATDHTTRFFFQELVKTKTLVSLYDFENRKGIFPGVHRSYKFCLLSMSGTESPVEEAQFVFFAHQTSDLRDPDRRFTLSPEDIKRLNPNTLTCPIFRSSRDAEITKGIYERVPVLINENDPENGNPWGITFKQGLFNMTSDSHLFRTREQLEADGWHLEKNIFCKGDEKYLPLYEAKMIHHYNHRFGDYADLPPASKSTQLPKVPASRLRNAEYEPLPRYWVPLEKVFSELKRLDWSRKWLFGFRDIARSTDERTCIASLIPIAGVGHKMPLVISRYPQKLMFLLGAFNSFIVDYILRNKMGSTHLAYFVLKQLPVIHPDCLNQKGEGNGSSWLADFVVERVLTLSATSSIMRPILAEFPEHTTRVEWDPESRFVLRCEIDAALFYIYNIAKPNIEYIMNQFSIVKRKDIRNYGDYRTLNMILNCYSMICANSPNA